MKKKEEKRREAYWFGSRSHPLRKMLLTLLLWGIAWAHQPPPGDLLCRSCGAPLFSAEAHVHGTILGGPRVAEAYPNDALGAGGTVHRLRKAGALDSRVDVAVYVAAEEGVDVGRAVTPPLLAGFSQNRATCGRCGATVGWRFLSEAHAPAAALPFGVGGSAGEGAAEPQLARQPTPTPTPTPQRAPQRGEALPYVASEEAALLAALPSDTPHCLRLATGWWTFRFCHGQRVEQFHEDTLWSLGALEPTGLRERLTSERGYYTSHFLCVGCGYSVWRHRRSP